MAKKVIMVFMAILLAACSKDAPPPPDVQEPSQESRPAAPAAAATDASGPLPPGVFARTEGPRTLDIGPLPAYVNSRLKATPGGFELPAATGAEDRMVWYLDGTPVSSADPSALDLSEFLASKGGTVQAAAVLGGEYIYSNHIKISNYPPRILNSAFRSEIESTGDISVLVETEDIDRDQVTVEYQWMFNGLPAGNRDRSDLSPSPGDDISVTVRVYDGEEYGAHETFRFQLINRAPRLESIQGYYMTGSTYIYNAQASDPDLDPVTYSLKDQPPGMTIDPESGQVRWDVPPDFLGTIEYTVVATDPSGLGAVLPVKFTVSKAGQAK